MRLGTDLRAARNRFLFSINCEAAFHVGEIANRHCKRLFSRYRLASRNRDGSFAGFKPFKRYRVNGPIDFAHQDSVRYYLEAKDTPNRQRLLQRKYGTRVTKLNPPDRRIFLTGGMREPRAADARTDKGRAGR